MIQQKENGLEPSEHGKRRSLTLVIDRTSGLS